MCCRFFHFLLLIFQEKISAILTAKSQVFDVTKCSSRCLGPQHCLIGKGENNE